MVVVPGGGLRSSAQNYIVEHDAATRSPGTSPIGAHHHPPRRREQQQQQQERRFSIRDASSVLALPRIPDGDTNNIDWESLQRAHDDRFEEMVESGAYCDLNIDGLFARED